MNGVLTDYMFGRVKDRIKSKNGTILGIPYKDDIFKLNYIKVQCENGHIWEPGIKNLIDNNSWCPECYCDSYDIDDLRTHAAKFGGKCLSKHYDGTAYKHT